MGDAFERNDIRMIRDLLESIDRVWYDRGGDVSCPCLFVDIFCIDFGYDGSQELSGVRSAEDVCGSGVLCGRFSKDVLCSCRHSDDVKPDWKVVSGEEGID